MKILIKWFMKTLINACICTFEPILRIQSAGSENINVTERIMNQRLSHILIRIRGVGLVATEMPKIMIKASFEGINRPVITDVPLLQFQKLTDFNGGNSVNSTTDAYILIPIGSIDTNKRVLKLTIWTTQALGANAFDCEVSGLRVSDNLPLLCYEYRALPASPVAFENVAQIIDTSTAYDSAITSRLQFGNGTKIDVPHRQAFAYANVIGKLETVGVWGMIHSDKDLEGGRSVTITPSASFNAFIITYSDLN